MSKSKYYRRKSRKFRKSRKNRTRRNYPSYNKFMKREFSKVNPHGTLSPAPISPKSNVRCSICDRMFARDTMFAPVACLQKNRERSHKICEECWWDPQIGFAREDAIHECPGCKRGLPLNPSLKSKQAEPQEIIVISD
jgi:hypothetical protein